MKFFKGNKITKCVIEEEEYDVDHVVWTGNPYDLCNLLGVNCPPLQFLYSKFVFIFLKKCKKRYQVCYYADLNISFPRGTILSNYSKTIIKNKNVSDLLCLEYTFKSKEEMASSFCTMKAKAIEDMFKVGIIEDIAEIESIYEINAPFSYPILTIDYREQLEELKKQISKFDNLISFGRQATFNYENVDIIIKHAINHPFFKD